MRKLKNITAIAILMMSFAVFAQLPSIVAGYLENPEEVIPLAECLTYKAWIIGGSAGDTLWYIYPGASATCNYTEEEGQWSVNASAFAGGFSIGDVVRIEFKDTCEMTEGDVEVVITSSIVDDGGLVIMSAMASISEMMAKHNSEVLSVSPNPFNSGVSINMTTKADYAVAIYDIIGNRIDGFSLRQANRIEWSIDNPSVSSGVYFVKVDNLQSGKTQVITVVYQK